MSRKKGLLLNAKNYPYIPAKLAKNKWRIYIEYWVWSFEANELVRRRKSSFDGKTQQARLKDAKNQVHQINELLSTGYMVGNVPIFHKNQKVPTKTAFKIAIKAKQQATGVRSKEAYKSFQNIFFKYLDDSGKFNMAIQDFTKKEALLFFDWLYEVREVGNNTRNNYKDQLKALFNEMIKREIITKNPIKGITDIPTTSTKNIPYTPEEQQVLEEYLQQRMPELFLLTRFSYFGFMRPIEIMRMKVKHIDLPNRIILVRAEQSKSLKQMPVVITSQLYDILKEKNISQYPGQWHLFSKDLKPGPIQWARNRVSELHKKALVNTTLYNKELTLYSWKHTGNCNAYRAGVDIKSLQQQNRHSSLEMTEIYLRSMGLRISAELKNKKW